MTERSARGLLMATRLRLAGAALFWERVWPACWPAVAVLAVFLILALFDLLPALPGGLHLAILLLLAAGIVAGAVAVWRSVRLPDYLAARRRIERASGLAHRPLQSLDDKPSAYLDPQAARLWEAHRQRMMAAAHRLRVGWPVAGLAARDPWGLRAALTILLLLAAIDAGGEWRERLTRALNPDLGGGAPAIAASLDIWVTPPEYTGLAPQFLKPDMTETIRVPTGSALLAQVHDGDGLPRLAIDGQARDFTAIDKKNFQISTNLTAGKRLKVTQDGAALGSWAIAIVPDTPPTVAFARPPEGTQRAALRLDYRAGDDYGVESVKAEIRRQGGNPDETIELPLPLPGLHLKEAEATSYQDLTPHPWAGLPVEIRLVASDALGQTTATDPVRMKLPEREFSHPVARAIIEQRKELVKDPSSHVAVAEILADLRERPQLYHDDTVAYLGLSVAEQRLRLNDDTAATAEVEQLLWDTALRIEDGRMSMAERELRRLQQELQDALARNAPDAEIDRLMRELQQALDRYLRSLAENMARNPDQGRQQPLDPSQIITGRDLQRMLERARELARDGARDQARDLLSQLQNMLENLRTAQPGQMQRGASQAQQMMRGMQEMMRRQQQLLDRSFRAEQRQGQPGQQGQRGEQGQPGQPGEMGQSGQQGGGEEPDGAEMGEAAGQQEALRHMLGDMMRRMGDGLGDIPDPLGRAERAMRDAAEALRNGMPGRAIPPQTDALDRLQQAAREFAEQMQRRLGEAGGQPGDEQRGKSAGQSGSRSERDPLGRPLSNNGSYDQGDVKIPDQNTLQRARAILDELRRRAGERFRPTIELDYIDRLLKRF
jgi:uncharacterized protein (TIGR02302 family)